MKIDNSEITIYEVESLHQDLKSVFAKGDISIDMSNVSKIDMSVIQLFAAAKKSCLNSSKTFELTHVNNEVSKLFKDAGCNSLLGALDE